MGIAGNRMGLRSRSPRKCTPREWQCGVLWLRFWALGTDFYARAGAAAVECIFCSGFEALVLISVEEPRVVVVMSQLCPDYARFTRSSLP